MKESMKKIIISAFALFGMLIATPILAHAADRFNTDPNDLPTIMVTNVTQDGGCSAGLGAGCWKTSVDARPGDTIAVQVYFHNATNTVAYDTHLSLQPGETSRGTTHTFSGGVASSSIDRATGSATVRTSSSQKLTFINGSVRAFRHGDQVGFSVDNESSLFGTGLSIDEVGVDVQGVLMAKFKVSNDNVEEPEDDDCRINNFTADDYTIDEDESTRLRWDTTDCDYVRISHISGNLDTDGNVSVSPNEDTKYTLTAYPGGDTKSLTIRVNEEDNDDCDIEFYADRTNITRGQSTKLYWDVSDGEDIDISNLSSNVDESGSRTVSPNSTTTYRLTVNDGDCDGESKSVTIYVDAGVSNAKPQAITNPATLVAATSAKLNGIAIPNANTATSAWFEWGPTPALGAATTFQGVGASGSLSYSYTIGGLVPNTTYYFRAVAQNAGGIGFGETLSFRTGAAATGSTTRVVQSTRVVRDVVTARSTASLLELSVESLYDRMCVGGEIEYIVIYRNISKSTLVDAVLQVNHPKQLVFIDATRGDYSATERKLTVDLGRLEAGEEGSIRVRGRVTEGSVVGDLIVTTATVVYTNPTTRAQEDAIAYSLTTVSDDCPNGLGAASLFGSGAFLPDTLLEWLLLILIILALILLGRNLYNKKSA